MATISELSRPISPTRTGDRRTRDRSIGAGGSWTDSATIAVLRQLAAGAALREDPETLVGRVFEAVAGPMELDFYIHYRFAGVRPELHLASTAGVAEQDLPALGSLLLGEAVCGQVAETRAAAAFTDVDECADARLQLAAGLGARTYASFPLLDGAELLGTLSFGSRRRTSLSEFELDVLRLTCDVLAAAIAHHRDHETLSRTCDELGRTRTELSASAQQVDDLTQENAALSTRVGHLSRALASHDDISQVKGMLMLRLGIAEDTAWALLVRLSQRTNRKLREVADAVAEHLLCGVDLPDDLGDQLNGGLAPVPTVRADPRPVVRATGARRDGMDEATGGAPD